MADTCYNRKTSLLADITNQCTKCMTEIRKQIAPIRNYGVTHFCFNLLCTVPVWIQNICSIRNMAQFTILQQFTYV